MKYNSIIGHAREKFAMRTSQIGIYLSFIIAAIAGVSGSAQQIRWHNESVDTLKINELLKLSASISDPQERVAALAQQFIDRPYVAGTLESNRGKKSAGDTTPSTVEGDISTDDGVISTVNADISNGNGAISTVGNGALSENGDNSEVLTINIDEVDCTTLIDYIMALALTGGEHRTSWRDFTYNLQRMRYRGGEIKGYPSRLHYISDWIVDNSHRGNFEEVTARCDAAGYEVKSLNFMSAHRDLYPALSDSVNFDGIKKTESGYRNHRYPIIKTSRVGSVAKTFLRTGDIVALCTGTKGLDVSHMGVIFIDDKKVPYLLHASSKAGKVIMDKTPLERYLTQQRLPGIRVIRLKE